MSDEAKPTASSSGAAIRPASILTRDTSQGLFPFEAFSFDPESAAAPVLTLNSPWALAGTFKGTGTGLTNAISGTASALASANPVLLAGQIGYETDTLSFKLGDGTTAYNSLTYSYRGLPVAGESSLGTPHPTSDTNRSSALVVSTSTNTAGVWSAAVTMTGVPTGAKAAWCLAYIIKTSTAPFLAVEAATGYTLSDITSGNNRYKYWGITSFGSAQFQYQMLKIHLDSSLQFKWCTDSSNSTVGIGSAIDYEM